MRKYLITDVAAVVILATGCAEMSDTQRRTATGAGVGALAGAVLSSATGGRAGTGAVVGAGVGALGTYIWSQNMERQKREMEQATQGTGIAVTQTQDNQLKLDIPSDISFAVGRSDIQSNFAPVLDRFAEGLRNNPNTDVRIIGHTDNTGSDAINKRIALARAQLVKDMLVRSGISPAIIKVREQAGVYYATNDTAEGRAANRRAIVTFK